MIYFAVYISVGIILYLISKKRMDSSMEEHKKQMTGVEQDFVYSIMKKIEMPISILLWPVWLILSIKDL